MQDTFQYTSIRVVVQLTFLLYKLHVLENAHANFNSNELKFSSSCSKTCKKIFQRALLHLVEMIQAYCKTNYSEINSLNKISPFNRNSHDARRVVSYRISG